MKIEIWQISRVKPYEKNPRLNDDAVDVVATSLREFGFRLPLVVNPAGEIICGHTRYKSAINLALEKVPDYEAKDRSPLHCVLRFRRDCLLPLGQASRRQGVRLVSCRAVTSWRKHSPETPGRLSYLTTTLVAARLENSSLNRTIHLKKERSDCPWPKI